MMIRLGIKLWIELGILVLSTFLLGYSAGLQRARREMLPAIRANQEQVARIQAMQASLLNDIENCQATINSLRRP